MGQPFRNTNLPNSSPLSDVDIFLDFIEFLDTNAAIPTSRITITCTLISSTMGTKENKKVGTSHSKELGAYSSLGAKHTQGNLISAQDG